MEIEQYYNEQRSNHHVLNGKKCSHHKYNAQENMFCSKWENMKLFFKHFKGDDYETGFSTPPTYSRADWSLGGWAGIGVLSPGSIYKGFRNNHGVWWSARLSRGSFYTNGSEWGNVPSATPKEKLFLSHKWSWTSVLLYFKNNEIFPQEAFLWTLFLMGEAYHEACRTFPVQEFNPHPLKWKSVVLTTGLPEPSFLFFFHLFILVGG